MTSDGAPVIADVDPGGPAVKSMSDQDRKHGNLDETERVVPGDGTAVSADGPMESVGTD